MQDVGIRDDLSLMPFTLMYKKGLNFVWSRLNGKVVYSASRFAVQIIASVMPVLTGAIVNLVTRGDFEIKTLALYVGAFLGLEILGFAVNTFTGYFWQKRSLLATANIKKDLWRLIQGLSHERWESRSLGMWQSRITRDAGVVLSACHSLLNFVLSSSVVLIVASVLILQKLPLLWSCIMFFGFLQIGTYLLWRKRFRHIARRSRENDYRASEVGYDLICMTSLLKCLQLSRFFYGLYDGVVDKTFRRSMSEVNCSLKYCVVMQMENWVMRGVTLGFCLLMFSKGVITLGDMLVYNMYVGQLIGVINGVTTILPTIEEGKESASALSELLMWCKDDSEMPIQKNNSETIKVKDLSFRYDNCERIVIRDFCCEIEPLSAVGFIGRNGAGKSTLIKLLMGIYKPTKGTISAPSNLAIVPQKNIIYNDSFLENVRLRDKSISMNRTESVIRKCGLGKFLETHPIHMKLKPNTLSGGEVQMIAIARAMVREPSLLVLDEVANNLDIVVKENIYSIINELKKSCTIVLVTHDLSCLDCLDRVFLFENGTIQEIISDSTNSRSANIINLIQKERK